MLISKFSPSTPISLRNQIQAAHPSFRNMPKNENFTKLVFICSTHEIVTVAIKKGTMFIVVGTILRVI